MLRKCGHFFKKITHTLQQIVQFLATYGAPAGIAVGEGAARELGGEATKGYGKGSFLGQPFGTVKPEVLLFC
jgi:hypothetical protein